MNDRNGWHPDIDEIQTFVDDQTVSIRRQYGWSESGRNHQSMEDHIFTLLTRSSFRRSRIDFTTADDVRRKVGLAIDEGLPLAFAVPFGGYKNYRVESFPSPDWAEVFHLNYVARYLMPVVESYEPGILLEYSFSSGVMDIVSNVPTADSMTYLRNFQALLELFSSYLPDTFRMNLHDVSASYDDSELLSELHTNYAGNVRRWTEKFDAIERARRVASAERNLMVRGVQDLSGLTPGEWQARCLDAAMWCEALDSLSRRRQFNKYGSHIQLVFVRGPVLSLHVGSCDTSSHHFWSGCGAIELHRGRLLQRILSQSKLEQYRKDGRVHDVSVDSAFSDLADAYRSIPVVRTEF